MSSKSDTAVFYSYTCPLCEAQEILPRAEALGGDGAPLPLRCYEHEGGEAPEMDGPLQVTLPTSHALTFQRLRRARQECLLAGARLQQALRDLAAGDAPAARDLAAGGSRHAATAAEGARECSRANISRIEPRRTAVE